MYYEANRLGKGMLSTLFPSISSVPGGAAALLSRKRRSAFLLLLLLLQSSFCIPLCWCVQKSKMMELEGLNFYLDGVTNFTFCLIGMTINAAAIGMLCRQKTTSIFVKLMITLVTYDLVYVFLSATCFSLPRLSTTFDGKTDGLVPSVGY